MTDPTAPATGTDAGELISAESSSASSTDPEEIGPPLPTSSGSPAPTKHGFIRRLARYTVPLGLLAGLAAATIYVGPIVNDRVIQPVETNTADTAVLQTSLEDAGTRIDQLEADAAALHTDLDTVNNDLATVGETATSNTRRLDDLDTLVDDQTARLDALDELAMTLGTEIEVEASSSALAIELLKSTELLSRARLFLYQANYGLAGQDVQTARDLLTTLLESRSEEGPVDTLTLTRALSRIDLVLVALPNRPVAASDDLDIAWRLLLDEPLSPLVASTNPLEPAVGETPPTTLQG